MNLKTTVILIVLVVVGGVFYFFGPQLALWLEWTPRPPDPAGAQTSKVLAEDLKPQNLTRIDIKHGDKRMTLERAAGGEWTLPGRWPTRRVEIEQLVSRLTALNSRFTPEPLREDPPEFAQYGLDKPAVTIALIANGQEYVLDFAEKGGTEADQFSRPTYLRLRKKSDDKEDRPEVMRLAPGLIAELTRPVDYYQQRRLFPPGERVARDNDPQEKVEQVAARSIVVTDKKNEGRSFRLDRIDEWRLSEPHRDLADPEKRDAILAALPDVWAEKFIEADKDLSKYGLEDPPQQMVSVTRPDGQTTTLIIGKESRREASKPEPEPNPFAPKPPPVPRDDTVYHYAKLQDNSQVFEIKFNKLNKDVLVAAADLRDPRVARFQAQDVRAIELMQDGQKMVFAKEKDDWRLKEPIQVAADRSKVSELLNKLSSLDARDKDAVRYKSDPKEDGLDKPAATAKLTVEEPASGARQPEASGGRQPPADVPKKTRTITLLLGRGEAAEAGQLFVKQEGWERINKVQDDGLLKLVKEPVLAFRNRRVLDFAVKDLEKIEVRRGDETYALSQSDGTWKLLVPGNPEADQAKIASLTADLSSLDAVEYVTEIKPEEQGLDKPALTATLTFTKESNKPAQKLLVGKQQPGKPEYFAKLDGANEVFLIRNQTHDDLDRPSLAYRPSELWRIPSEGIASLRIQKEGEPEYRLDRQGVRWKITGPFEAETGLFEAQILAGNLLTLRSERFETNSASDPSVYGLDKPYLRLTVVEQGTGDKPGKERTLLVGKPVSPDSKSRFAKLADGEAVFVLNEKVVAAVDRPALDLLDRQLLKLDPKVIAHVQRQGPDGPILVLQRTGQEWSVVTSPDRPRFSPDREVMADLLHDLSNLQAQRFVAYGPTVELAKYGLDKPEVMLIISQQGPDGDEKKLFPHFLTLGKPVEGATGERYAKLGDKGGVVILSAATVRGLIWDYLHFVDRTLLQFDSSAVTTLQRSGTDALEIAKRDGDWQIVKPAEHRADEKAVQELFARLDDLRAQSVAAYPAKDLKPFGLDEPAAVLTIRGPDAKEDHVLKIGKVADEKTGDRFVMSSRLVNGEPVVAVLPGALARRLLAGPLAFRDRALARFADADRVVLERGTRKATFAKVDGTWKLVEPVEAQAEQSDLEDLINALARLRADELVAEKPADLKPYGLDKPEARWRFQSGDKDVLHLLIGSKEKDGPRSYAKLATGDVVFLLDPRLTGRLLAEYRTRNAWPVSLDAVQIEALTYRSASGTFTLEKIGNAWEVAGKPEMKLNVQTVNETLAALAGLRASRYVQDSDTDLNLYGLEPPETVLEITTRTGKRMLHLGRPEGESKRHYARVPDKQRPGVFIIAEADAERLLRDVAAFMREPASPLKPGP